MSRRAQSSSPSSAEKPPRSKCTTAICFSWKVFTCVISHVTLVSLVVAYCIGGALLFQHLEQDYELEVKKGIRRLRENITDSVWDITDKEIVLVEKNWTQKIEIELERFERQILTAIKTQGWDGEDGEVQTQWTFFGALFYSIIVITTIGYGHIAPRTDWGKVTTIVYAILGIPLMLLCLSSIGDVMAGSFKFLYWRVCCFMCTRETKASRRQRSLRSSIRHRYSSRSHLPGSPRSFRSSYKYSDTRRATSLEPGLVLAYSGTDLTFDEAEQKYLKSRDFYREINEVPDKNRNIYQVSSPRAQQYANRSKNRERFRDRQSEPERHVSRSTRFGSNEDLGFPNRRGQSTRYARSASAGRDITRTRSQTLPMNRGKSQTRSPRLRAKSADPRSQHDEYVNDANKATVYWNSYALDELQKRESVTTKNQRNNSPRSQSMPRQAQFGSRLEPPEMTVTAPKQYRHNQYFEDLEDDGYEMEYLHKERRPRNAGSPKRIAPPSPSMMSPMGMATRRHPQSMLPSDDIYFDEFGSDGNRSREEKQVPIWLCVFLVVSYIVAGAFLFHEWEKWTVLDSAYFCFITLTTIGFGDFVPAQGVKANSKESIALCSLYLLFGISLLAMSFNLVQEEVINNVKELARRLGILKEEDIERTESVESNLNEISYSDSYRPPINRQKVNTRP